jgi:hypothetical protein
VAAPGAASAACQAVVSQAASSAAAGQEDDMPAVTDVVDAQISAYRERDLERFLACYAADVVIRDFDGNVLMGSLDVMREQYGQLFRDSPLLSVEIPRRMVVGDHVIDEEQVKGFNLPGSPAELHAVVVYQVKDQKIQSVMLLS